MISQSYRSRMDAWISDTSQRFGSDFAPYASQLRTAMRDERMSDDQLRSMALDAKRQIEQPRQNPRSDWMYMKLIQHKDGIVTCMNPNTGYVYATLAPSKDGMTYMGPASFISKLGGRGEISTLVSMLEDGDYLHNLRDKK